MRSVLAAAACALGLIWTAPASAEVTSASAGGFVISAESDVAATPAQSWRALSRLSEWWNDSHTYSGDADNLRLDLRAGGCWCERWRGGEVEHARVVLMMENEGARTLRLIGGLGPLQEMGATGVLTFTITPTAAGSKISMTYRVSGDPGLGFEQIAPLVDGVLMEQFGRLSRYSATGSPG